MPRNINRGTTTGREFGNQPPMRVDTDEALEGQLVRLYNTNNIIWRRGMEDYDAPPRQYQFNPATLPLPAAVNAYATLGGNGTGQPQPQPVGIPAYEDDDGAEGEDIFALDDAVAVRDWRMPSSIKKNASNKVKEVYIDYTTYSAINELTEEILQENFQTLGNNYKNKIDILEKKDYTTLLEEINRNRDDNSEREILNLIAYTMATWKDIESGKSINCHDYAGLYLTRLEDKAKSKYSIEHSKYKFYPRLKKSVKYGNPELLSNILKVTQIGKGKVICKR